MRTLTTSLARIPRIIGIGLCVLVSSGYTSAQTTDEYPTKTVRIVVPYPAGGGTDAMARMLAPRLAAMWGQPVIVENKAGASGNLGLESIARAPADGYTLVMMPSNHSINPPLFGNLKFDPVADFTPIVLAGSSPVILAVHSSVPVSSVSALIDLARARPGALSYASCGSGTPQHLAGELFKSLAKVDLVYVPYKGCAPAVMDVVGGQVQVAFSTVANLSPHIKSGKLTGIAVTTRRRSDLAPELPTVAESGLPDYDVDVWFGLLGPARLPAAVVSKINADVNRILADPEVRDRLLSQAFEPYGGTPGQFATLIDAELKRWRKLITDVGIKAD